MRIYKCDRCQESVKDPATLAVVGRFDLCPGCMELLTKWIGCGTEMTASPTTKKLIARREHGICLNKVLAAISGDFTNNELLARVLVTCSGINTQHVGSFLGWKIRRGLVELVLDKSSVFQKVYRKTNK